MSVQRLGMPGVPIFVTSLLSGDDFFFAHDSKVIYASPGAARLFCILLLAGGWPMRDLMAADEDC